MEQLFMESAVRLAPIDTIKHGISSASRNTVLNCCVFFCLV